MFFPQREAHPRVFWRMPYFFSCHNRQGIILRLSQLNVENNCCLQLTEIGRSEIVPKSLIKTQLDPPTNKANLANVQKLATIYYYNSINDTDGEKVIKATIAHIGLMRRGKRLPYDILWELINTVRFIDLVSFKVCTHL